MFSHRQILCAILFFLSTSVAGAADWPHWRGPQRNDFSPEPSGYKNGRWNIQKPAWRINVGKGCSSPLVVDGRIYTMGWKNGKDHVYCLDAASGKEIWSRSYSCPLYGRKATGDQGQYAGPSSTPEFDTKTGLLYTLSIDGDVHCWDTKKSGRKVWTFNLHEKYRIERRPRVGRSGRRDYGFTTAPLVHGDWLLVEVGAAEGSVMAFDKRTGKEIWRSELKEPAGHTGGLVPMTVEGVSCVVVLTHFHLAVIRLDKGHEGKTVATHRWITEFANNIPTPAVQDNYVVFTSAYNHMKICKLRITLKGAQRVWEKPYPSGVCSPVIHKGKIYLAWRTIRCLDFKTGNQLWEGGRISYPGSCIVTGDDRLIVWGASGHLLLVETAQHSPNRFKVLAQNNRVLSAYAWPHVVLADGRLYCKDRNGSIVCFRVR